MRKPNVDHTNDYGTIAKLEFIPAIMPKNRDLQIFPTTHVLDAESPGSHAIGISCQVRAIHWMHYTTNDSRLADRTAMLCCTLGQRTSPTVARKVTCWTLQGPQLAQCDRQHAGEVVATQPKLDQRRQPGDERGRQGSGDVVAFEVKVLQLRQLTHRWGERTAHHVVKGERLVVVVVVAVVA